MGKTTLSKPEIVMQDLDLPSEKPNELIDFLTDAFVKANCNRIQLNAISNSMVSDTLFAFTGHRICPSNFTYYKSRKFDLTALIATELSIPVVDSAKCNVYLSNNILSLSPYKGGPIEWFNKALSMSTSRVMKSHYEIWRINEGNVGSKRNWPNSNVFEWCKNHDVIPSMPVSHDTPTKLRRIFRYVETLFQVANIECPKKTSLVEWIDQKVLVFSKNEVLRSKKSTSNWLPSYSNLPEANYVESVDARDRRQPYIYCKFVNGKSKFGKAEGTTRFKIDDIGIVIGLKLQELPCTADIEQKVISMLKNRNIYPVHGTREHYSAPLIHLAPIILDIIAATPYISTKVRSVVVTTKHSK
jgi:hypothetical protein